MIVVRRATPADVPKLRALIDASVRGLQASDYSAAEIERALATVYGVDTRLIADGTYYVAEDVEIVGCGGWSRRATLFGGDQYAVREDSLLDACETAAREAGYTRLEMGATLTGVPFYEARGYQAVERVTAPLPDGETLAIVRMEKSLSSHETTRRS